MDKNYKIIAFEGLDCSFKETNCKAYIDYLRESHAENIWTASFPRYNEPSSMFVRKWLGLEEDKFDKDVCKKHPMARDSFYAMDRFCYWFEKDYTGKSRMDIVLSDEYRFYTFIFDRYTLSNAIYNPIYTGIDIRDFSFDRDVYGIPLPDVVVWMRMKNFDVLKGLIAKKENKDELELDTEFLYKTWLRSEEIIKSDVFKQLGIKLVVIDCLNEDNSIKSRDEIFDLIKGIANN